MVTMKRRLVAIAAALAVASTTAVAQGVKMTDKQLDEITAAGAQAALLLSNPGNANVMRNPEFSQKGASICINCAELAPFPTEGGTGGAVAVTNPAGFRFTCIAGGVSVPGFGRIC